MGQFRGRSVLASRYASLLSPPKPATAYALTLVAMPPGFVDRDGFELILAVFLFGLLKTCFVTGDSFRLRLTIELKWEGKEERLQLFALRGTAQLAKTFCTSFDNDCNGIENGGLKGKAAQATNIVYSPWRVVVLIFSFIFALRLVLCDRDV